MRACWVLLPDMICICLLITDLPMTNEGSPSSVLSAILVWAAHHQADQPVHAPFSDAVKGWCRRTALAAAPLSVLLPVHNAKP